MSPSSCAAVVALLALSLLGQGGASALLGEEALSSHFPDGLSKDKPIPRGVERRLEKAIENRNKAQPEESNNGRQVASPMLPEVSSKDSIVRGLGVEAPGAGDTIITDAGIMGVMPAAVVLPDVGINTGVRNKFFGNLCHDAAPQECAQPLLAKVLVNRSKWSEIQDLSHQYFLLHHPTNERDDALDSETMFLFSTGVLWDGLDTPYGALPVVPGMRLIGVHADRKDATGFTWSEVWDAVPFEGVDAGSFQDETFEFAFQAGYDLRDCWGEMMTYDIPSVHVCGHEALAQLAVELQSATAQQEPDGKVHYLELTNFHVETIDEFRVTWLMEMAPQLKEEGDRRQVEQQDLCFRSALDPICAVIQVPGVCKAGDAGCDDEDAENPPDVFWMVKRSHRVPEVSYKTQYISYKQDHVQGVSLTGPQTNRYVDHITTVFKSSTDRNRGDIGFGNMFSSGLKVGSCGSRDAALTTQLDTLELEQHRMTAYRLSLKFWKPNASLACTCRSRQGNVTYWPVLLRAENPTFGEEMMMSYSIGDWLRREVRQWWAIAGKARSPNLYRENFMRMWPHYFHQEQRTIDANQNLIVASTEELAEPLEKWTRVRVLEKVKFRGGFICGAFSVSDCKGKLVVNDVETTLYVDQIPADRADSSTKGSTYKFLPGDVGTVVEVVRPGGSHAPMVVVQFDKFPESKRWGWGDLGPNETGVPAPVFRIFPHQLMAVNRVVIAEAPRPTPTPPPAAVPSPGQQPGEPPAPTPPGSGDEPNLTDPNSTGPNATPEPITGGKGSAAAQTASLALMLALVAAIRVVF